MKIVIDLSEKDFVAIRDCHAKIGEDLFNLERNMAIAIRNGTPLPKGHGRLIDADDVDNHIIGSVDLRGCPTIIEADTEAKNEDSN